MKLCELRFWTYSIEIMLFYVLEISRDSIKQDRQTQEPVFWSLDNSFHPTAIFFFVRAKSDHIQRICWSAKLFANACDLG